MSIAQGLVTSLQIWAARNTDLSKTKGNCCQRDIDGRVSAEYASGSLLLHHMGKTVAMIGFTLVGLKFRLEKGPTAARPGCRCTVDDRGSEQDALRSLLIVTGNIRSPFTEQHVS